MTKLFIIQIEMVREVCNVSAYSDHVFPDLRYGSI